MVFEFLKRKEGESLDISRIPPENKVGRKTREEHKLECEILIKGAVKAAAIRLAREVIVEENKRVINEQGFAGVTRKNSLLTNMGDRSISFAEIDNLEKEERVEESISGEMRSDRELSELLIVMIERGEKSPEELGKALLLYKELGKRLLDGLETKRLEKRKKLIAEEERLAKEKMGIK